MRRGIRGERKRKYDTLYTLKSKKMKKTLSVLLAALSCLTLCAQSSLRGDTICYVAQTGAENTYYATLSEALDYANLHPSATLTIVLTADYTLPSGGYTLPANATLLVPCTDDATADAFGTHATPVRTSTYVTPSQFRQLTMAAGARLTVNGVLEMGAQQASSFSQSGAVSGAYGRIQMEAGSAISLESGAILRCWGYMTGAGMVDAKRGAIVREFFQMTDWKGGTNTNSLISGGITDAYNYRNKRVFPINQYYIQNVEVATTYHPGAKLIASAAISAGGTSNVSDAIVIVGTKRVGGTSEGLLQLNEEDQSADTWVRKTYLPATDQQFYEVNSDASIGSMKISVSSYNMDSKDYILPITNNMWIRLLTGYMDVTQSTEMLPGAIIENMKETTVAINSGKRLYLYDSSVWKNAYGQHYTLPVCYSPTKTFTRPDAEGNDAELFVHGTWNVEGGLFTSAGGAYIHSTNSDAGKIVFLSEPVKDTVYLNEYKSTNTSAMGLGSLNNEIIFSRYPFTTAVLRNTQTPDTYTTEANENDTYCFINDTWSKRVTDGCWTIDETLAFPNWKYYANPGDFVEVSAQTAAADEMPVPDANTHLFYSLDSTRTFILLESNCQWWEVKKKDGLYYSQKNGKYYEYDADNYEWHVALRTVTWMNGTETMDEYEVAYRTEPAYLGDTPTREGGAGVYYRFLGWNTDADATAPLAELDPVVTNITYYAIFQEERLKQQVTFVNYDGTQLASSLVNQYSVPNAPNTPERPATDAENYRFTGWQSSLDNQVYTELPAVGTADVTYTAVYEAVNRPLDIVEWTSTEILFNMNGYEGLFTLQLNENTPAAVQTSEQGLYGMPVADLQAGDTIHLRLFRGEELINNAYYAVPALFSTDATLSASAGVVRVLAGNLTISGEVTISELYVNPGATVLVNGSLTCDRLVVRTEPDKSGAIIGTFTAGEMCYTRITGTEEWPLDTYAFALPLGASTSNVRLSDGSLCSYGTSWELRYFDQKSAARKGFFAEENWKVVADKIMPAMGYILHSAADTYREYYFPVNPSEQLAATPADYYAYGEAEEMHAGWNFVSTPSLATIRPTEYGLGHFLCALPLADGSYLQTIPAQLQPAQPFFHQVDSISSLFAALSPAVAVREPHLQLVVSDGEMVPDEAHLYLAVAHSDEYEVGADMLKLTTTAQRPLIYTRTRETNLAFNALPAAALEGDIDLMVYAPESEELTLTAVAIAYDAPLEQLFLYGEDHKMLCDLLQDDYHFTPEAASTTRFILSSIDNGTGLTTSAAGHASQSTKIFRNGQILILRDGMLYTITGLKIK